MRTTIFSTTANTDMVAEFVDAAKAHNRGSWRIVPVPLKTGALRSLETTDF